MTAAYEGDQTTMQVHRAAGPIERGTWSRRRLVGLALVAWMAALMIVLIYARLARAAFGVAAFDGDVVDGNGSPYTAAGGHPFSISTYIDLNTKTNPNVIPPDGWPEEPVKDLFVDLPPGLVGNPTSLPRCSMAQLASSTEFGQTPLCPSGSQIGRATVRSLGFVFPIRPAVYLIEPPPNVPARFGFNLLGTVVVLDGTLRSGGDYGITVSSLNLAEGLPVSGASLTIWGVPADPAHDELRACPGEPPPDPIFGGGPSCGTEAPIRPFLRLPTSCTAPGEGLVTTLRTDSWFNPGHFVTASFESHLPPGLLTDPPEFDIGLWGAPQGTTDCDRVPFDPEFTATPASSKAGAPSAYEMDLTLPQNHNPKALGEADLKKAVVTLPAGLRVSPSSAAGLGGCSTAQVALRSLADPTCPDSSKIGSLRIETPLLEDSLTGAVYLATPKDNPSGTLIALYLVAKGPGLVVKLAGRVDPDPITGQLRATFDDNPQLPFSKLHLEFKGGPRAALVNPQRCGTYTTQAELTSWSGETVVSESSFTISKDGAGTPCPTSQFSPDFDAGVDNPVAGGSSSFMLSLNRGDDDEELSGLAVSLPNGLLARLKGVPRCNADTAGKEGTCSEASRIGDVLTGAGAGTSPFYLPGRVYLTDGYNGGSFGLSIVVPAVAGPFDLGTVVVRSSLRVNKRTAKVSVVSDPLPTILEGIPLQVRDIRVNINRPRFMVNPTSCAEKKVLGTIESTAGTKVSVSKRFEVGECAALALKPRMRLTVGARGRTQVRRSTPLTAELTQTPGQSNLKSVKVTLPLSLNALLPVVNAACTQAAFDAGNCEDSLTGSAVAVTPLLDEPLKGSAYFVKNPQGGLPNLVVALRGQVDFDLVGKITIPGGTRLSTRFTAPDVPIKSFSLKLVAGKDGAVGVAESLCTKKSKRQKAQIVFSGQNGRVLRVSQRLSIRGCRR